MRSPRPKESYIVRVGGLVDTLVIERGRRLSPTLSWPRYARCLTREAPLRPAQWLQPAAPRRAAPRAARPAAELSEPRIAAAVRTTPTAMLHTVNVNDEPDRRSEEVYDEARDHDLAPKRRAKLASPERLPQMRSGSDGGA
jgi:hypothetical protein